MSYERRNSSNSQTDDNGPAPAKVGRGLTYAATLEIDDDEEEDSTLGLEDDAPKTAGRLKLVGGGLASAEGFEAGATVEVPAGGEVTAGRGDGCTLRIRHARISTKHVSFSGNAESGELPPALLNAVRPRCATAPVLAGWLTRALAQA